METENGEALADWRWKRRREMLTLRSCLVGIALIFLDFGLLWAVDFPPRAGIDPESYYHPAAVFVELVFVSLFGAGAFVIFRGLRLAPAKRRAWPFAPQNFSRNSAAKCNPLARAEFLSLYCHDDAERVFGFGDLRADDLTDHLSDVRAIASARASHILEETTTRRDGCKSVGSDDGRLHQASEPDLFERGASNVGRI